MQIKAFIAKKAKCNPQINKILNIYLLLRDFSRIRQKILNTPNDNWYLVLTPEHGNLGDHAIAKAESNLLKKCRITYTEITGRELKVLSSLKKLHLLNGNPIMINGGGNLGTLWFEVEKLIRGVIIYNPDSEIIIMPSTIYYDDMKQFYNSARIYNSHKKLHIYARESISYDMMKDVYHNVELAPDMVFSLNACKQVDYDRQGCLLCLRSDCERTLNDTDVNRIIDTLKPFFDEITLTDTVLKYSINPSQRNSRLEEKFSEFRRAKLVITDRLHGMIFAFITGTPCIVLNSKSPKLKGCYKWIQDTNYIFFLDNTPQFHDEFEKAILSSLQLNKCKYDNDFLIKNYEDIENVIRNIRRNHGNS